jgi:hypothetical protein
LLLLLSIIIIIWYELYGITALMYAAEYGHIEVVLSLIKANAYVNDKNKVSNIIIYLSWYYYLLSYYMIWLIPYIMIIIWYTFIFSNLLTVIIIVWYD